MLTPLGVIRYRRAAHALDRGIRTGADDAALHRSWSESTPGAIAIARNGRIRLADCSTGYRPLTLDRADIRNAEAITYCRARRSVRPLGIDLGVAMPLGGGVWATFASRAKRPATTLIVSHAVVIRYAAPADGADRVSVLPFGQDLSGAHFMAAVLDWKAP